MIISRSALTFVAFSVMGSLLSAAPAVHCKKCGKHHSHGQMVEKVEMRPILVKEMQTRTRIVHKEVEREEEYTVFEIVPKEREITKDCWYLEPEVKQQRVEEKKCVVVAQDVVRQTNIRSPAEPSISTHSSKGKCAKKNCSSKAVRMVPTVKEEKDQRPTVLFPTVSKDVDYVRMTPKKHTITVATETVQTLQPVTRKRMVKVCVPEVVSEQVEVNVWREQEHRYWVCKTCCKFHQ